MTNDPYMLAATQAGSAGADGLALELIRLVKRAGQTDVEQLRTVSQFSRECPAFSRSRLHRLLLEAESNGLEQTGAAFKDGARWMIHMGRFDEWYRTKARGRPARRTP